jgi:hypothetical protein
VTWRDVTWRDVTWRDAYDVTWRDAYDVTYDVTHMLTLDMSAMAWHVNLCLRHHNIAYWWLAGYEVRCDVVQYLCSLYSIDAWRCDDLCFFQHRFKDFSEFAYDILKCWTKLHLCFMFLRLRARSGCERDVFFWMSQMKLRR